MTSSDIAGSMPDTPRAPVGRGGLAGFDPQLKRLALVVVIGSIMSILDTTIVNVAIATLARDFRAPLSTVQWVSTGYLLALAMTIPLTGWAVERFGARTMWITSLGLFLLGSALSGASWSIQSLIVFRILQGIGGGMIMPIGQSIMATAAGPQRMGRVMSLLGVPMLLGPILGPVIGGLILDSVSWRWIFYVNLPIGIVAIALALRILPRHEPTNRASRLDVRGLCLLSPGLGLVVYGLSQAGQGSAASVWVPAAGGVALIAAFVVHALKTKITPLIEVILFRDRQLRRGRRDHLLVRCRTLRRHAAAPALLPGGPRAECPQRRAAHGSPGDRCGDGDAPGRLIDRQVRRRTGRAGRTARGVRGDGRVHPARGPHQLPPAGRLPVRARDRFRFRDDAGHLGRLPDALP